jgi:hypothetical protein
MSYKRSLCSPRWICEYTYRWPWRLVYFQGLNVQFNFAEIRDRFRAIGSSGMGASIDLSLPSRHSADAGAQAQVQQLWERNHEPMSDTAAAARVRPSDPRGSDYACEDDGSWKEVVRRAVIEERRSVVLLTSPPGAGKTYLAKALQGEFESKGDDHYACRFDCSDDRLVMTSLSDLLDQTFGFASRRSADYHALLVADEFHLLNDRQKNELFAWFSPHLSWLRVLLIGNRILRVDTSLMNDLLAQQTKVSATSSSGTADGSAVLCVETVIAELTPESIMSICVDKGLVSKEAENHATLLAWFAVNRSLFGLPALSLRAAFALCDSVRSLAIDDDSYVVLHLPIDSGVYVNLQSLCTTHDVRHECLV